MIRRCARVGAAALAVGAVCVAVPVTASAQTADEQFEQAVAALGVPVQAGTDVPAFGRGICDSLRTKLTNNANPVPVVRGAVKALESSAGLERGQAVGLLQAAVTYYCPEYGRLVGR